jgi:hypothetical protein
MGLLKQTHPIDVKSHATLALEWKHAYEITMMMNVSALGLDQQGHVTEKPDHA